MLITGRACQLFRGQEVEIASEVYLVLGVVKQSSVSEKTGGTDFKLGGNEREPGASSWLGGRCGEYY